MKSPARGLLSRVHFSDTETIILQKISNTDDSIINLFFIYFNLLRRFQQAVMLDSGPGRAQGSGSTPHPENRLIPLSPMKKDLAIGVRSGYVIN